MDLITTSSPTSFFSTPRTPTGRMLSNKHVSEFSMQMAGSVCSFAYNYHFLHLHLAFDKCFGKCFLLSFYLRTHELHLGLDRNIPPPSCAHSPHCFMTSHPVASCHITVQRGPSVEWHGSVSQLLWWDLQLQGWGGGWGGNPWVWRRWSNLKRSSCIGELPIFLHFYTTSTISSVSWARGTVC